MARSPIEIAIASETKAFRQGIETGVIQPLEDAVKELRELGDADGAEKLERSLKEAQKATENLADETKLAALGIERDYKRAYAQARQASDDGTSKMKDGAQEVTQELGQNLGQAVSSVRGDLSDLGQVGQDTLGGLAATLAGAGPAGIAGAAVLAAGAVGLGLVTAELEAQEERAEKLRDRLSSAYQEAAKAGRDYLDVSQLIANMNDLMYNPDRADEWKQLQEDARKLRLDESTLIKANGGDLTAQAVVQKEINGLVRDESSYREGTRGDLKILNGDVAGLRDRWAEVAAQTKEQVENTARSRQMTSEMLLDAADKAGQFEQAIDEAGNKLISLPDGTEFVITADTGQATADVSRFGKDADDVIEKINGKIARPRVVADIDTRDAEAQLDRLARRHITVGMSLAPAFAGLRQVI